MRTIASVSATVLLSCGAFGQAPAARLEFEAATVKVNKSGELEAQGGILPGGAVSGRNLTLGMLMPMIYKVPENYIVGAPSWFGSDRFDIVAKAPPNSSDDDVFLMVQTLLADQFKLAVHREQKPMNVFELVVGKGGPKFQKAAGTGKPDCKRSFGATYDHPEKAGPNGNGDGQMHAVCVNMTMADLAEALPNLAPGYIDRQVVDSTGLKGTYDLNLAWVGRNLIDQGGITMPDAVDKQLGLKLEEKKLPMSIVVIDHAERLPDN
jgi:uncharacterized protein (TIGR03435 family)